MLKLFLLLTLSLQTFAFNSSDVTFTNFPTHKTRGELKMDLKVYTDCKSNNGIKSKYRYMNYDSYTLRPKDKPVTLIKGFDVLPEAIEYAQTNSCVKVDVYTFSDLEKIDHSAQFYGVHEKLYRYFFHCRK